jgi:hypothetical protein
MEANGSALTNKYSEGLPRLHNYGGNEWTWWKICVEPERWLLFSESWGVNVQSYSGSTANFSAFHCYLALNDRIDGSLICLWWTSYSRLPKPQKKHSSRQPFILNLFRTKLILSPDYWIWKLRRLLPCTDQIDYLWCFFITAWLDSSET